MCKLPLVSNISPLDNSPGSKVNPHFGLSRSWEHTKTSSSAASIWIHTWKPYLINCRIPYKLGRVITRWNWETVWECALLPPLFSKVYNQGKLGLSPNLVPGFPFQCGRTLQCPSLPACYLTYLSSHSPPAREPRVSLAVIFDQLQGAHLTLYGSLSSVHQWPWLQQQCMCHLVMTRKETLKLNKYLCYLFWLMKVPIFL